MMKRVLSCCGLICRRRRNQMPGHEETDENDGNREDRNQAHAEHRIAFLPSLQAIIAFVTKRERHCDVDEIKQGDLRLLDHVRYFRSLKSLHPGVYFEVDTLAGKVHLRGRGNSFEDAFDKCFRQVREMNIIVQNLHLNLEEKWKWAIIANVHCQQYFEEHMASNDIMAEITAGNSDDLIIVTALNDIEWQKARKLLDESLIEEVLPIPNGADISFEGSQFRQFKTVQEKNKPLRLSVQKSDDKEMANIQLVGVKHVVVETKKAAEEFIETQREKEHELTLKLSGDELKFLDKHFSDLVKPIERNCKVSMKLEDGIVRWKGPPESFPECEASLEELCKRILEEDKTIELPGVEQLFQENTDGAKMLQLLQEAKVVYIPPPSSSRRRMFSESAAQKKDLDKVRIHDVKHVVGANESLEKRTILLKHGRIKDERADVLAYFARPDLNDSDSICGQALKKLGGATYIEACKPFTNISKGDIVCTTGGNLACQYVFHAVGCDREDNKENNEKVDRKLINKCLQKCIDLQVASLAMISFQAEEHTAKEMFEIVREEMEQLINEVEYPLPDVEVLYLEREHLEKQKTAPSLRRKSSLVAQKTRNEDSYSRSYGPEEISKISKESQINIPASKRDEDKILLHFVGIQPDVSESISDVIDFVDRNKAAKSIQISKDALQFCQKHTKELELFSCIYHVSIYSRNLEITVEGITKNVFECWEKITCLLSKYERNKEEIKRPPDEVNMEDTISTDEMPSDVDNNAIVVNISKDRDDTEPSTWLWEKASKAHRERFEKFLEYRQEHPEEIKEINEIRFCIHEAFCIGHGSDGTRVYIGLGRDGYEKAVKCFHKDGCDVSFVDHEKKILNEPEIAASKHTVKYHWYSDDESDKIFAYLILDLCEETLEEYVERNDLEDLLKIAPEIIRQILEGLNDLHHRPRPILHRDLKPSNIMRNMQHTWMLVDFGISRTLPENKKTHESKPRGNEYWRAAESHRLEGTSNESNVLYQKESDIQTAGMVSYFIVTKGKHAFGPESQRVSNILNGNPVGLNCINDPVLQDFLVWMLSHNPEERPSAKKATNHPYLQSSDEQFELLCTVGNQYEIKTEVSTCNVVRQIDSNVKVDWRSLMDPDVYKYLCIDPKKSTPNKYSRKWTACLRFIRNANQHWNDPKSVPRPKLIEGEPQDYFLKVYPSFPMTVHKILRSCDWKERKEFKKFFS